MAVCEVCGQVLDGYIVCPDCGVSLEAHKKFRVEPGDVAEVILPVEVLNEAQWSEIKVGDTFAVLCSQYKCIDGKAVISIDQLTILVRVTGSYSKDVAEIIVEENAMITSEKISRDEVKMTIIAFSE